MNSNQNNMEKVVVHWSGVDVAKRTFEASLVLEGQKYSPNVLRKIPTKGFARTKQGANEFLAWLDDQLGEQEVPQAVRVVMESTGKYSVQLAAWLIMLRPSLGPAIVNPYQASKYIDSLGVRNITDRLAARGLGFFGQDRQPAAYEPAAPELLELRSLNRMRDVLVNDRTALKNRAGETTDSPLVKKILAARIRQINKDIKRIEKDMKRVVKEHDALQKDLDLLCTIYGVAFRTAATMLAELGDLRRFKKARQLSAFVGMNPRIHDSGTSVKKRPKLSKQGNPRVRTALYMSAMTVIRGRSELQETYCRLTERGMNHRAALGVVMRKLLILMRAMLIEEKEYDPWWKTPGKTCADAA